MRFIGNITCSIGYCSKKKLLLFYCIISIVVTILYSVNSFIIKPLIIEDKGFIQYFMLNYFNDFWAGVIIAVIPNILLFKKGKVLISIVAYMVIWIVASLIWEFLRPFVLLLFNPFNKVAHFLWGDFVAYLVGTLITYVTIMIIIRHARCKKLKHQ